MKKGQAQIHGRSPKETTNPKVNNKSLQANQEQIMGLRPKPEPGENPTTSAGTLVEETGYV